MIPLWFSIPILAALVALVVFLILQGRIQLQQLREARHQHNQAMNLGKNQQETLEAVSEHLAQCVLHLQQLEAETRLRKDQLVKHNELQDHSRALLQKLDGHVQEFRDQRLNQDQRLKAELEDLKQGLDKLDRALQQTIDLSL